MGGRPLFRLDEWAKVVAHFLKDSGFFYIHEFHPSFLFFSDSKPNIPLPAPYFRSEQPTRYEGEWSYTGDVVPENLAQYQWSYTFADVLNGLIGAGLELEFLHEFSHCGFRAHNFLEKCPDGLWRYGQTEDQPPMMFSIRARKKQRQF